MEWIPRAMSSKNSVSPAELKTCDLCGTLNYEANRECFTCGWRGRFGQDAATIELAWGRLFHQHEGVLMEHVTARGTAVVGDFGRPRQANGLHRLAVGLRQCRYWWKNAFGARRPRTAPRVDAPQPAAPQTDL